MRSIGIMQGRLTPRGPKPIQFFPFDNWQNEFKDAVEIGINEIEFIFDFDRFEENPLWSDPGISPMNTVQYYENVVRAMGGASKITNSIRLFMVPGMNHCRGGAGADTFDGIAALGNLIALNENGMLLSPSIEKRQQKEIERFFGIPAQSFTIAGSDLVGSGITCTKQGFIAHPKILQKEFNALKKLFCVSGKATSVNYGDAFVGNSVLANAYGALVGTNTTPSELLRIDEGLGG